MTRLYNSWESNLADGTAISAGNSGGSWGNAVNGTGGTAPTFSRAAARRGALGMSSAVAAASQSDFFWDATALDPDTFDVCSARWYMKLPSAGTILTRLTRARTATVQGFGVALTGGDLLRLVDGANADLGTGTRQITNSWCRVEYQADRVVGDIELRLFQTDPEGLVPDEIVSCTDQAIGTAAWDEMRFGLVSGSQTFTIHYDDVMFAPGELVWLGPTEENFWSRLREFPVTPYHPLGQRLLQTRLPYVGDSEPVGGVTFPISLDGSLTPAGNLVKEVRTTKTGSSTASGALIRQVQRLLTGGATPAATLLKQVQRLLEGSSSATGSLTLTRLLPVSLAGSATPAGALVRQVQRLFAGSSTASGSTTKQAQKLLAGSSTPTSVLATLRLRVVELAGSLTPAGSLTRQVQKLFAGSSSASGALTRLTDKRLTGSSAASGALATTKVLLRSFAGTVAAVGSSTRSVLVGRAGSVAAAGTVSKQTQRRLTASTVITGALNVSKTSVRSFSGTVTISGAITRRVDKSLTASISSAGQLVRRVDRQLTGSLTVTGELTLFQAGAEAIYARVMAFTRTVSVEQMVRRWAVRDFSRRDPLAMVRRAVAKALERRQT